MNDDILKKQIQGATNMLRGIVSQPQPALGIDLDGCVDEFPSFFNILTCCWPGRVVVITLRNDRAKAEAVLKEHGIRHDEIVLVSSLDAKAQAIADSNVCFYIDDQPETLKNVPSDVAVLLLRNEGNFDSDDQRWMFSRETAKLVC